jgi:hemolysin activation/secretion protein
MKIEIPETPALTPASSAQRVPVRQYRLQGNTAFDEQTLQAVLAVRTGDLSFADLDAAAREVTVYYRSHGYPLARAYLPRQEIADGVVTIAILEGRYDRITVHNGSRLSDERATRVLQGALCRSADDCSGALISRGPLERGLLLLNDLPGVQAAARLSPGSVVGTSALEVDVADGTRVSGVTQLDNTGGYYSGTVRALGTLWVQNPLGIGDQFTAQAVGAGVHGSLGYGALGYALPLGYGGLRLSLRGSYVDYQLGDRYESLDAHGNVKSLDAGLSYPFIRSRDASLTGTLTLGERRFRDAMDAAGSSTSRRIQGRGELGLGGDMRDALLPMPGFNTLALFYTAGQLRLDDASSALDASTARTQGHYAKWGVTYSRLQPVTERTSVYLRAAGQFTSENLDSYEKFPLGGPDAVRAYAAGEMSSDKAVLYSVELRQRLPLNWGSTVEGVLLYDWASGRLNASPWQAGVPNRVTLRGMGVGINVALGDRVTLRSTLAWRGDRPMTAAPDRHCNLALALSAGF